MLRNTHAHSRTASKIKEIERLNWNLDTHFPITGEEKTNIGRKIEILNPATTNDNIGPLNKRPEYVKLIGHWREFGGSLDSASVKFKARENIKIGYELENPKTAIRNKVFEAQRNHIRVFKGRWGSLGTEVDQKWGHPATDEEEVETLLQSSIFEKHQIGDYLARMGIKRPEDEEGAAIHDENIDRMFAFGLWAFPGIESSRNLMELAEVDLQSMALRPICMQKVYYFLKHLQNVC